LEINDGEIHYRDFYIEPEVDIFTNKPLKIAWEAVIGSVAWIFKNHGKDQLATNVEFEGNLKSPDININGLSGLEAYMLTEKFLLLVLTQGL
jgi:hypothetical protein